MLDIKLIIAVVVFLISIALVLLDANGVLHVPPFISEALFGVAGWLGLRRPGDEKKVS